MASGRSAEEKVFYRYENTDEPTIEGMKDGLKCLVEYRRRRGWAEE